MKIASVELIPVHTERETGLVSQHVVMTLSTDEGLTGLGEMSDVGDMRVVLDLTDLGKCLTNHLAGQDPFNVSVINQVMAASYRGAANQVAVAVDMALHDLVGKALGVPLYKLLGGKCRDRIKVCYPIFPTRDMEEVGENLRRVRMRLGQGHDMVRYYWGVNLEADEAFLKGLREEFGERVTLHSLDGSGRLPPKEAIPAIRRLEEYGPLLVESPCRPRTPEALAEVRREVRSPISEHVGDFLSALRFAQARAVDIFNAGGTLQNFRMLFGLAQELGLATLIGTTQELSIHTAFKAHIGVAMPNLDFPCDPMGPVLYKDDVVKESVRFEGGYMYVPEGPGLGVELDWDKIEKIRKPLSFAGMAEEGRRPGRGR